MSTNALPRLETLGYADILEHMPVPVWVWSETGQCVYANPAICGLLGYSQKELLGVDFRDMVDFSRTVAEAWFQSLNRIGRWKGELAIRHSDGSWLPVLGQASACPLPGGGRVYVGSPRPLDETATRSYSHIRYRLTGREHQVLRLMTHGLPDKTIARELGISVWTVNRHVTTVLSKMDASSRTEAAVRGLREGIVA